MCLTCKRSVSHLQKICVSPEKDLCLTCQRSVSHLPKICVSPAKDLRVTCQRSVSHLQKIAGLVCLADLPLHSHWRIDNLLSVVSLRLYCNIREPKVLSLLYYSNPDKFSFFFLNQKYLLTCFLFTSVQ